MIPYAYVRIIYTYTQSRAINIIPCAYVRIIYTYTQSRAINTITTPGITYMCYTMYYTLLQLYLVFLLVLYRIPRYYIYMYNYFAKKRYIF